MKSFTRYFSSFLLCLTFTISSLIAQEPLVTSIVGYPVGTSAEQVAYGNGKYILLGSKNVYFSSIDGESWSRIQTNGVVNATTLLDYTVFGKGLFVAVGDNGIIQTSDDGVSWVTRNSGTSNKLMRVYFINDRFFATGFNRTLLASDDGIIWTQVAINVGVADDYFNCMTYGNGVYLLGGRNNSRANSVVYRSATAGSNSWSYHSNPMGFSTLNRIQFLNNKFFAFHSGSEMHHSNDGLTWTLFTNSSSLKQPNGVSIPWGSGHQIFNGIWDGSRYYFYGSSQYYQGYGSTFISQDGTNMELIQRTAYIVPQSSELINGKFFVVGNEGIVSSTDGLVYKHSGASYWKFLKTQSKYVAVGAISNSAALGNSNTFGTWTDRTPSGLREIIAVANNGSFLLAGGYGSLLRSDDEGSTWTTVISDPQLSIYAMAYGQNYFVKYAYDAEGGYIARSANGVEWNKTLSTEDYIFEIKHIDNKFFAFAMDAVSYMGKVSMSADGISWTDITPTTDFDVYYYKDIAFDGTKYHLMGVDMNQSFFTLSSATPTVKSSYADKGVITNVPEDVVIGGVWDEGVITYSNGYYTSAGVDISTGQDYILYSTDGINYTALPQEGLGGIVASNVNGNTVELLARGNAYYTITYAADLPVIYNYFKATAVNDIVKISWSTSSETNNLRYEVMHSIDGASWNMIGKVEASRSTQLNKSYQIEHAYPAAGLNYYRLVQVDLDGKRNAGVIRTVNLKNKLSLVFYPNPVTNTLIISSASAITGTAKLYSVSGQLQRDFTLQGSMNRLDVSSLAGGLYHLELIVSGEKKNYTIVKK